MFKTENRRRGRLRVGYSPGPVRGSQVPSWGEAIEAFLLDEQARAISSRTLALHRECFRALEKYGAISAGSPLQALGEEGIKRVVRAQLDAGVSARTVNLRLQSLRQLFRFCVQRNWLSQNPAANVRKLREEKKLVKTLKDDDEARRLLGAVDTRHFAGLRDYVMMLLILDAGLRLGEVLGLVMQDVDLQRRTLRIRRPKDREERVCYFSSTTATWLRRYLEARAEAPGNQVFVSCVFRRIRSLSPINPDQPVR